MGKRRPYRDEDDDPTAGYHITKCGLEDCEWQQVDGGDAAAYRHLGTAHGEQLERLWQFGRLETHSGQQQ